MYRNVNNCRSSSTESVKAWARVEKLQARTLEFELWLVDHKHYGLLMDDRNVYLFIMETINLICYDNPSNFVP